MREARQKGTQQRSKGTRKHRPVMKMHADHSHTRGPLIWETSVITVLLQY